MSLFKTITQGGQVHLHQLRMLKQVIVAAGVVSLCVGLGTLGWSAAKLSPLEKRYLSDTYWAKFLLITIPEDKHPMVLQKVTSPQGGTYEKLTRGLLADRGMQRVVQGAELKLIESAWQSLWIAAETFFVIFILWFGLGVAHQAIRHKRGNTIVHWKELRRRLRWTGKSSDLNLGKMPLLKDAETSHILLTGTTGTGKSNTFHILLPQIRKRQNRAIIVDLTGEYISRYYRRGHDIILNPLDERSVLWSPWADCENDFHYDVLAESLIPSFGGYKDPFWDNASRIVLKTALRQMAAEGRYDIEELHRFLVQSSDSEFEDFFLETEAVSLTSQSNEKTTLSIRSTLSSHIEGLQYLVTTESPFSIRNWIRQETDSQDNPSWLFITARPDQRPALIPLISAWINIAINELMILPPNTQRRLWFVMDELAALRKLSCLLGGLAEGRKYGSCFLAGFQSKQQLEAIYTREEAAAMLDLFNTKIFFRCTEPTTQQWISKVLGDHEAEEPNENISFGAHSMRDGVSLGRHIHQRALVLPSELSLLENLYCYLKLPGNHPVTQLKMSYAQPPHLEVESFVLREERRNESALSTS